MHYSEQVGHPLHLFLLVAYEDLYDLVSLLYKLPSFLYSALYFLYAMEDSLYAANTFKHLALDFYYDFLVYLLQFLVFRYLPNAFFLPANVLESLFASAFWAVSNGFLSTRVAFSSARRVVRPSH